MTTKVVPNTPARAGSKHLPKKYLAPAARVIWMLQTHWRPGRRFEEIMRSVESLRRWMNRTPCPWKWWSAAAFDDLISAMQAAGIVAKSQSILDGPAAQLAEIPEMGYREVYFYPDKKPGLMPVRGYVTHQFGRHLWILFSSGENSFQYQRMTYEVHLAE